MIYIVIGGQFGSEGKGEFVGYLAKRLVDSNRRLGVVRTGGPNAGHTLTVDGQAYKMRQLPCAWHLPGVDLFIGPGSVVNPVILSDEVRRRLCRVYLDGQAVLIDPIHIQAEQESDLVQRIGSTATGVGAAKSDHIWRRVALAGNPTRPWPLGVTVCDVTQMLNQLVDNGSDILIETSQGFGLSLSLSGNYPYVTSKDVSPGQALNDVGLSSRLDHLVIVVLRAHPIRVAGQSGPLSGETSWADLGLPEEHTTATGRLRRVGMFDLGQVCHMSSVIRPNAFCITHLDYLQEGTQAGDLIKSVEDATGVMVRWAGYGPSIIYDLRPDLDLGLCS